MVGMVAGAGTCSPVAAPERHDSVIRLKPSANGRSETPPARLPKRRRKPSGQDVC